MGSTYWEEKWQNEIDWLTYGEISWSGSKSKQVNQLIWGLIQSGSILLDPILFAAFGSTLKMCIIQWIPILTKLGRLGSAFLLSQQTIWNILFRFFHPFGWERSRSLLRRRDLSLRLRLHLYGIWSVSLCVIVSHQIHREISTTWVSGSVICHASDGPFYTHTWSDHRKFMMRILIVWGWIDSSDPSLASDQLNVRPRLHPNQLRGSGISWFIVWVKSGLICPSYEGGQIARESIYLSISS